MLSYCSAVTKYFGGKLELLGELCGGDATIAYWNYVLRIFKQGGGGELLDTT